MRILAVRGCNLASLAGEFEVDLAGGALGGAGVFAIVGPTGAGKSTLLDAICVALFDRTPRLANRSTVVVGRGDDDPAALGAQDVRTILRRGATAGWAEVDFESGDQRRYRARWSVRRARDRIDGNLQAQAMSLTALDSSSERFGGTRTETLDAIHERLGLSFDQFRRSALLAQGEFAAFLRADGRDRSELLERMTGTEIYTRLSIGAHLRSVAATNRIREGRVSAEAIAILDAGARAAVDEQLRAARVASEQARERKAAVEGAARWVTEALAMERGREAAIGARDAAREAHATAEPLRAELVQRRRAERLRALWDAATTVGRRLTIARSEVASSTEGWQTATADLAELVARRAEIGQLHAPVRAARIAAGLVERTIPREQIGIDEAASDAAWVGARGALGPEVAAWPELDPRFAQRATVADQIAAIDGTLRGHAEHKTKLARQREMIVVDQRAATAKFVEVKAKHAGLKKKPAGPSLEDASRLEDAARIELGRAERLVGIAAGARSAVSVRDELDRQLRELGAAAASDRGLREDCKARHAAALVLRDERSRVAVELRRAGGLSHARAELVAGEPCPLCGATEHPWSDRGAFDDVIRDAERRLAEASGALDAATNELARLDARESSNARDRERLANHRATAAAAAADATPIWQEQLRVLGELAFVDDPATPTAEAISTAREAAARAALEAARAAREAVAVHVKAASDAQAELMLFQSAVDETSTRLADHDRRVAELDATIERVKGERVGRIERHTELATELDAAIVRWTAALPDDERATWIDGEGSPAGGRFARGSLVVPVPRALAMAGQVMRRAGAADDDTVEVDASELGGRLDQARLAMAQLASSWRTRIERVMEADAVLGATLAELDVERGGLERAIAEHAARRDDATRRTTELDAEHKAAITKFDDARIAAGIDREIDSEALFSLLADSPARVDQIAERLQALDRTLDVATAMVGERSSRIVAHAATAPLLGASIELALEPSEIDDELFGVAEALATFVEALVSSSKDNAPLALALQTRIDLLASSCAIAASLSDRTVARLAAELEADLAARARRTAALDLLVASEREAEIDRVLGDVIGSHDGKLFRSFAQSLTLDGLLAVTNSHLEELAPRYQLERVPRHDLELQVIDRDLGGEVRSVQSLSGGESFLVSLALALGLSSMSAHDVRVRTLLIDEGFGTLDPATLDGALSVLDRLQATGRQVGVISHVPALVERVGAHVRVHPRGGGRSDVITAS